MYELTGFAADMIQVLGGLYIAWRVGRRLMRARPLMARARARRGAGSANG